MTAWVIGSADTGSFSQECFIFLCHLSHGHSQTCLLPSTGRLESFVIALCLSLLICETGKFSVTTVYSPWEDRGISDIEA